MKPPKLAIACWSICLLFGMLMGCMTPQQQEWTCQRAADAYDTYLAAVDAGVVTDKDVLAAGKIAAAFLHSYCGWQTPVERSLRTMSGIRPGPSMDQNGVLVLTPPH